MLTSITYIIYTAASIALTIWVGRTLFTNGRIFILDSFGNDIEKTDAVNKLLLVGFYLLNIGFVALFLRSGTKPTNIIEAIEFISTKLGVVLIVLGGMHFFNMFNIAKMSRKASRKSKIVPATAD